MKKIILIIQLLIVSSPSFSQTITTIAGIGGTMGYSGDGGLATAALLHNPAHMGIDCYGNIVFADYFNNAIRKISPSGIISTIAGTGTAGYTGDGGPAIAATIYAPNGLNLDAAGNIYFADQGNNVIRMISVSGTITTVAGNGTAGYSGDGGPATSAELNDIVGVSVDGSGNIYIADYGNQRVRKVNSAGIISTLAGTGVAGFSGDGGPGTDAKIYQPTAVNVDKYGNVYLTDQLNNRIRKIDSNGVINTIAGNGTSGYSGDGGLAVNAELYNPSETRMDIYGNLYIDDSYNNVIRKVDTAGIITTFAGNGTPGFSGDGGPASSAEMNQPWGLGMDACGNIYITDAYNDAIRKVTFRNKLPSVTGANIATVDSSVELVDGVCGIWHSGNNAIATIDSVSGVATGVAVGVDTIHYSGYCGTVTDILTVVANTAGVGVINSNTAVAIMPNPTTGNISVTVSGPVEIEVYNTLGQLVKKATHATAISIADMPPAMYLVKLYDAKGRLLLYDKVVKQ